MSLVTLTRRGRAGADPARTARTARTGPPGRGRRGPRPTRPVTRLALAGLALATAGILAACSSGSGVPVSDVNGGDGTEDGLHGVVPTERFAKPALDLTDTEGRPFDLREQTRGKITLLFFGYTMCPDVCPTTMADLASALDEVDPEVREQVAVVFVSTDPERDTGEVIRRWLNQFDETFIGLRGPFEQVRAEAEALGVAVEEPVVQADGSVRATHGSQVIAFGRDDRVRLVYTAGTTVPEYIDDLPVLVAEQVTPATTPVVPATPTGTATQGVTAG